MAGIFSNEKFTIQGDLEIQVKSLAGNINSIQKELSKIELPKNFEKNLEALFKNLQKDFGNLGKSMGASFDTKGAVRVVEKDTRSLLSNIERLQDTLKNIDLGELSPQFSEGDLKKVSEIRKELENIGKIKLNLVTVELENLNKVIQSLDGGKTSKSKTELGNIVGRGLSGEIEEASKALDKYIAFRENALKRDQAAIKAGEGGWMGKAASDPEGLQAYIRMTEEYLKKAKEVKAIFETSSENLHFKKLNEDSERLQAILSEIIEKATTFPRETFSSAAADLDGAAEAAKRVSISVQDSAESAYSLNNQFDQLKNRAAEFFTITNAFRLVRNAVKDAWKAVKELDSSITEISVVTDMTSKDLWGQINEYTAMANKLGATTLGAYDTAKLYYQQGLENNKVMEVSTETIKMARIANMDYAQATNYMTASLKGFKLEVEDATRVNDVYSELAAITAADTQEIAEAMTKTASIANSAGMSFETTSAFITQMLETTREAPENIGTALKTIIARFQEMKKSPTDIFDFEGEVVDVNKVEAALRSVGVALRDTVTGQFRDLDDVFLELASKFSDLDKNTQRYIATTAAGSRQQSRFLAMMDNYGKTIELVAAANDSAGSANRQFEKTLDSLESKLNGLQNAWNEMTMGIANNVMIKGAVDGLTGLLGILNDIVGLAGPAKGAVTLILGGIGLNVGSKVINKALTRVMGTFFNKGEDQGKALFEGILSGFSKMSKKKINIVDELFDLKGGAGLDVIIKNLDGLQNKVKETGAGLGDMAALNTMNEKFSLLGTTLKASSSQVDLFKAAVSSGVPVQEAMVLLTNKNIASQVASNSLKGESIVIDRLLLQETIKQTTATMGLSLAQLKLNLAEKQGVISKTAYIAKLLFAKKGQDALTLSTLMGVKASTALGRAIMGIPLGWFAVAVGAVVGVLVALDKIIETNAEKAERLKKEIETFGSISIETQNSYEELKAAIVDNQSAIAALGELTKGTESWNSAINNLSQDAIELMKKYPELSGALEKTEEGYYRINQDRLDSYIKELEARSRILGLAQTETENKLKLDPQERAVEQQEYMLPISYDISNKALSEFFKQLDKKIMEEGESFLTTEDGTQYSQEVKDLVLKILEESGENTNLTDYAISAIISGYDIDEIREKLEEEERIRNSFNNDLKNSQDAFLQTIDAYNLVEGQENYFLGLNKVLGNALIDGIDSSLKDMEFSEDKLKGVKDLFPDKEITDEIAKTYLLQEKRLEEINKIAQAELPSDWWGIPQKDLYKLLSGQFTSGLYAATQGDSWQVSETREGNLRESLYKKLPSEIQSLISAEDFGQIFGEFIGKQREQFNLIAQDVPQIYADSYKEILSNMDELTVEQLEKLKNLFVGLDSFTDKKGEGEIASYVQNLLTQALKKGKYNEVFNLLSGVNIKNQDSILTFFKDVVNLGYELPAGETIESMAQSWINLNDALKTLDIKKASTGVTSLNKILKDIGEGKRTFSEEDYNLLKDMFPSFADNFIMNLDGTFDYLGGDINSLEKAIYAAIAALQQDTIDRANLEISAGKAFKNANITEKMDYLAMTEAVEKTLSGTEIDLISLLGYDPSQLKSPESQEEFRTKILEFIYSWQEKEAQLEATTPTMQYQTAQNQPYWQQSQLASQQRDLGQTSQGYEGELIQTGQEEEVNPEIIKQYTEALKQMKEASDSADQSVKNLARANLENAETTLQNEINTKKYIKSVGKLLDSLQEGFKDLKKWKKGTKEYEASLGSLYKLIGMPPESGFLEDAENLKMAEDAANGSYDAFSKLQDKLAEHFGFTVYGYEDFSDLDAGIVQSQDKIIALLDDLGILDMFEVKEIVLPYNFKYLDAEGNPQVSDGSAVISVISKGGPGGFAKANQSRGGGGGSKGGGGGGSKKEKEEEPWENKYDWLYNLTEDINEELRAREKLELRYNRILRDRTKDAENLLKNVQAQEISLREQQKLQNTMINSRSAEMNRLMADNTNLTKYAGYNFGDNTIEINWSLIDSVKDKDEGEKIEKYIDKLEKIQSEIEKAEDSLEDIEDQIYELSIIGREQYRSFEERVIDALHGQTQDLIDAASELNNSINYSNDKLIKTLQDNVNRIRQDRANEKAEEGLTDKERRLAYLRQDTSGGNQMEILNLEQQLEDERQSYTDSLIDQKITELQVQNDIAREQRERQIELAQANLDFAIKTGEYWEIAHSLINQGLTETGKLLETSELVRLLKSQEAWEGLSKEQKTGWWQEIEEQVKEAAVYLASTRQLEDIGKKSGSVTFLTGKGEKLTGAVQSDGSVKVGDKYYHDVFQMYDGSYRTFEREGSGSRISKPAPAPTYTPPSQTISSSGSSSSGSSGGSQQSSTKKKKYCYIAAGTEYGPFSSQSAAQADKKRKIAAMKKQGSSSMIGQGVSAIRNASIISRYKKGGMAPFTGPAWLDGTPSKPEAVLNQEQTSNFVQLRDILSDVLKIASSPSSSENSGFGTMEVHFHIEEIGNRYELEDLIDDSLDILKEKSAYRNTVVLDFKR